MLGVFVFSSQTLAGPALRFLAVARKVLVINEENEPVPVKVMSGGGNSGGLGTEVVTFWDNECSLTEGDVSPVIETDGYTRLSVHPFVETIYWAWDIEVSLDNVNWSTQDEEVRRGEGIVTYEIVAPYYRAKVFQSSSGCVTLEGYLK